MTPLLLLHGALGAKNQFEPLLALLPAYQPVYSLNLPGHGGESCPAENFTMQGFVQYLLDWLAEQELPAVHIFGYSMGGYVALEAARQQPEQFAGIFTLATKFRWTPQVAQQETAKLQPQILEEKVPAFAKALQERHAPQDWKVLLHRTAGLLQNLGEQPLLTAPALAQIPVPVRIAVGDRDQMVSVEESWEAYRQLPTAQFQVLPNTKHPLEQLDWPLLAAALRHFFKYA